MIERKALSVSLPLELHAFVNELAAAGGYANAIEVMRSRLRLLRHEEALRRVPTLRQSGTGPGSAVGRRPPARDRRDARG